ncbi:flagellar protein [Clostridium sp. D2Q-14]|uniref:TIGR02530 family flagellar biosynthesis protein n=1 Tax=Anaeromonas gelatinilytica TaxID=2683194 RepID=UPI00193B5300|nr:TIGR02530 family flagellar biosynthesis protein [Anaeromonas gelatinilytica]MBS4536048.1 flagellar protein [Anaeromonas gelatinilytica]
MQTYNINQISHKISQKKINTQKKNNNTSFEKILNDVEKLKFSNHAVKRIDERKISIDNDDVLKINDAIDKAKEKGVEQALILMDNKAFIASVKNNTIITSINSEQLKNNIFTNIDGTVII